MTRTRGTIIVLLICLVVLLSACLVARSLIAGRFDDGQVKFLNWISKTDTGRKLIDHYWRQVRVFISQEGGPYEWLESSRSQEVSFLFAGVMFAGAAALFVSFVSLLVFVINARGESEQAISRGGFLLILLLIVLNGTIIRLILASAVFGNYDMYSYHIVSDIVARGGNVYAETARYNYSPLWFLILGALKKIQLRFSVLSFHFIVRSFLCAVDLLTLAFLLLIAKEKKISLVKTAIFFYLNPVSFLITGYHGQFENLAIFMVVLGLFAYLKLESKPVLAKGLLWIFATFGMFIKHNIFYELIICLNSVIKRYWAKLLLFAVSVCLFLAMFLPYWGSESKGVIETWDGITYEGSSRGIILNVFMYPSAGIGVYGITSLFYYPPLRYVFIVGMFIFPLFLKGKDIVRQCLLGMLFFVAFTTGISIQYFVLPIALGALRQSKGFMFYTLVGSLFILGDFNNVFVPGFNLFQGNIVWVGAMCWFAAELYLQLKEHNQPLLSKIKNWWL